jgi:hypothetical protein
MTNFSFGMKVWSAILKLQSVVETRVVRVKQCYCLDRSPFLSFLEWIPKLADWVNQNRWGECSIWKLGKSSYKRRTSFLLCGARRYENTARHIVSFSMWCGPTIRWPMAREDFTYGAWCVNSRPASLQCLVHFSTLIFYSTSLQLCYFFCYSSTSSSFCWHCMLRTILKAFMYFFLCFKKALNPSEIMIFLLVRKTWLLF